MEMARRALAQPLREQPVFDSPQRVKDYLALQLGGLGARGVRGAVPRRQHRLLQLEEMFRGTLTQTSVYPREVVRRALALNAGAVILAHNHPSGVAEPSRADEFLTQTLKSALAWSTCACSTTWWSASGQVVSMAERGLL
jgi:DNA repair protein RadC